MKTALIAPDRYWLDQLPIILFEIRIAPDEDNRRPCSIVTGRTYGSPRWQPMIRHNFLSENLHWSYPYRNFQRSSWLQELWLCLRIDRVRSPLEAPYQGPYRVLDRTNDTFTIEAKLKPEVVSIDRAKLAVRSAPLAETPASENDSKKAVTSTRTGCKQTFNPDPLFHYFYLLV